MEDHLKDCIQYKVDSSNLLLKAASLAKVKKFIPQICCKKNDLSYKNKSHSIMKIKKLNSDDTFKVRIPFFI